MIAPIKPTPTPTLILAPEYTAVIVVTYLGPTDNKGSPVRLRVPEYRRTVTLPYDYGLGSAADTALRWCRDNEITVLFEAESPRNSECLLVGAPECLRALRTILG